VGDHPRAATRKFRVEGGVVQRRLALGAQSKAEYENGINSCARSDRKGCLHWSRGRPWSGTPAPPADKVTDAVKQVLVFDKEGKKLATTYKIAISPSA
jgi:hypothetical protein